MVASNRKMNAIKGFAEEERKDSPMIGSLGGRVTRSRCKLPLLVEARENSATGGQTSDKLQECSPENTKVDLDQKKKNTKLASYHKKKKVKVASDQKKKNVKVTSHQKKKSAKVVPKESKKAVAENPTPGGLTPEQLQEYSRKDFDYTEFHGFTFGFPPYYKAVTTQINPKRPASYFRERRDSDCSMDYYNREFGVNYCYRSAPLLMTSRVVGGGYLDFITLDACKLDLKYERFQAIVYNAPGEEPKVLMCRPELRSTSYRGWRVYGTRATPVAAYLDSL